MPRDGRNGEATISGPFGPRGAVDPWSLLEEFASVIGHELRTPLTVVKGAALTGIVHHDRLGAGDVTRLLETIVRNSDLALLLVDRIGLARDIEADQVQLARAPTDLAALVAESVADLGHVVLADHPVEVTGADVLLVSADPTALREIVFNVLSNAAKYSAAGTRIEVIVRPGPNIAAVVVRDHGTGVPPHDSETIFGKFTQGDSSSPGAGLGLYISRGLARAHGGDLRVRSAEDHGSEFVLTLPA